MSKILVLNGKHGDSYYKFDSDEEKQYAALEILEMHFDYFIYNPGKIEDTYSYKNDGWADLPKSEEEISKLETDEERVKARQELKRYFSYEKEHLQSQRIFDLSKKALDNKDGDLAWKIISHRNDLGYEYEEFYIETLSEPNEE